MWSWPYDIDSACVDFDANDSDQTEWAADDKNITRMDWSISGYIDYLERIDQKYELYLFIAPQWIIQFRNSAEQNSHTKSHCHPGGPFAMHHNSIRHFRAFCIRFASSQTPGPNCRVDTNL